LVRAIATPSTVAETMRKNADVKAVTNSAGP
jgi:hypothetical protein